MSFIADIHIHSYYSRATSKQLNLEHLNKWAQLKGVQVVATGDFTHPAWLDELQQKLESAEEGLFRLKNEFAEQTQSEVFKACEGSVRFILSTEISNIYKKGDRVRKIHNVVLAPSFEAARQIQRKLDKIGNIKSDGRPILGLDARDLLEIILAVDDQACLIPAHIWTPWFSVLGSKSGFNSIEECYEDLNQHIFAVETGLSSDPPMNWRVSSLDKYTLVSNSDAHSPQKLAREANLFKCDLSYPAMLDAMKTGDPELFGGTIEFYPEEGKYHFDGHRKCNIRLKPEETLAHKGICPVCGKQVTLGVSYRVEELADRQLGEKHDRWLPYQSLIPLAEIIAEVKAKGVDTQVVTRQVEKLLTKLGPELTILRELSLKDIENASDSLIAEGIRRMRAGELQIAAGYDGEYGTIHLFTDEERNQLKSQIFFFEPEQPDEIEKSDSMLKIKDEEASYSSFLIPMEITSNNAEEHQNPYGLNELQWGAVQSAEHDLLIVAGPGTGKTRTLTYRIAHLIRENGVPPAQILAVTFTNKAADEMHARLRQLLDEVQIDSLTIKTFHSLGAMILREESSILNYPADYSIYNETDKKHLLKQIANQLSTGELNEIAEKISHAKNQLLTPEKEFNDGQFVNIYKKYQHVLQMQQAFDFDDLIFQTVLILQSNPDILQKYQQRFRWISVDEYQDINFSQYQLLRLFVTTETNLCVIGDPDQAIYGFRGSDYHYFLKFKEDFPSARVIYLEKNYRSNTTILNASSQVIEKNPDRKEVKIWSDIMSEGKLEIFRTPTEKAEAETIVHQIEKLMGATSFFSVDSGRAGEDEATIAASFADIAVLYRLHAQLPALEEAFIRSGIPYQTLGETPFWERKEVSEIISYLKVLHNPHSELELSKILNMPPRGIGDQTIKVLFDYKKTNDLTLWQALEKSYLISSLSETQKRPLKLLVEKINELRRIVHQSTLPELIELLITISGMGSYYKNDSKRTFYWKAMIDQTKEWALSLPDFLERIILQRETDIYDPKSEKVTLMSLHASKGLEFSVVFITGCEEGLIPYHRKGEAANIEEERRLFYVGMTRARLKLILTHTASRFLFGERKSNSPSRFLSDIEEALKEHRKALIKKKKTLDKKDDPQISLFF